MFENNQEISLINEKWYFIMISLIKKALIPLIKFIKVLTV